MVATILVERMLRTTLAGLRAADVKALCSGSRRVHLWEPFGKVITQRIPNRAAFIGRGCPEPDQQLALVVIHDSGGIPTGRKPFKQVLNRALPGILTASTRSIA